MSSDRLAISATIAEALALNQERLRAEFLSGPEGIRSCVLDDVLPADLMDAISEQLPDPSVMLRHADFRERKYVTAEIADLQDQVRELILGLASGRVAQQVSDLTGEAGLEHDRELYNGGLTMMVQEDFMMPHLDNSHDKARSRRRAIVMLLYLTDWQPGFGGALKLWSRDQRSVLRTIEYRRNRLVLLETTNHSWHSVQPITGPARRINVTTYFYESSASVHPVRLTRYAGWRGRPLGRAMARADFAIRTAALKMGLDRFVKKRHVLTRPVASSPVVRAPEQGA
jgi:Rps23 Pro-64 3,4-dihydroxylase Tpa1-like proline 4-hydroxylase